MRIDKYLKVSRLIKRREVAKQMLDLGLISINDKVAKPASEIKENDKVTISNPNGHIMILIVLQVLPYASVEQANNMYQIIESK